MEQIIQIDNKFYKEAQIVMLPTDKVEAVGDIVVNTLNREEIALVTKTNITFDGVFRFGDTGVTFTKYSQKALEPQHLYILSDDEVKEGDICVCLSELEYPNEAIVQRGRLDTCTSCRKIIASTDPSLNLLPISQEFLKQYVQAEGIDKVLVQQDEFWENYSYGQNEYSYEPSTTQGFIDLRLMPAKSSWNREEVIRLLQRILYSSPDMISTYPDGTVDHIHMTGGSSWSPSFDMWIEQNLK